MHTDFHYFIYLFPAKVANTTKIIFLYTLSHKLIEKSIFNLISQYQGSIQEALFTVKKQFIIVLILS